MPPRSVKIPKRMARAVLMNEIRRVGGRADAEQRAAVRAAIDAEFDSLESADQFRSP